MFMLNTELASVKVLSFWPNPNSLESYLTKKKETQYNPVFTGLTFKSHFKMGIMLILNSFHSQTNQFYVSCFSVCWQGKGLSSGMAVNDNNLTNFSSVFKAEWLLPSIIIIASMFVCKGSWLIWIFFYLKDNLCQATAFIVRLWVCLHFSDCFYLTALALLIGTGWVKWNVQDLDHQTVRMAGRRDLKTVEQLKHHGLMLQIPGHHHLAVWGSTINQLHHRTTRYTHMRHTSLSSFMHW